MGDPFDRQQAVRALRASNPNAPLTQDDMRLLLEHASPAAVQSVLGQYGAGAGAPIAQQGGALPAEAFPNSPSPGGTGALLDPNAYPPRAAGQADNFVGARPAPTPDRTAPPIVTDAVQAAASAVDPLRGVRAFGRIAGPALQSVVSPPPNDTRDPVERAVAGVAAGMEREAERAIAPLRGDTSALPDLVPGQGVLPPDADPSEGYRQLVDDQGNPLPLPGTEGGTAAAADFGFTQDGSFGVALPGVQEPILLPPGMDVGDFLAEAQANNALYGNVSGGSTPSLTPELANAFAARYARALGAAAPTGTGGGEPRMDATVRNQMSIPGQVSPETMARLEQAGMVRGAYQQAANNGMLAQAAATSAGQSALGTEQEAAAQAAQAEAAARQEELRGRLTEFESRLESVAHRRIDPEQYFGGFGGRLAASLAVALGELGRGLTGGDVNGPLGIINAAIERNIRAQEANLSNEQTGVANAGHALSTMRGILGDDAAAQAASRALHLAAAENRLMAMSSGLSGANAQLTARLREALGMERQAAQQMAAELAARGSQTTSVTVRGPESRVMGAVGRLQAANAPGASQGTQEPAQGQGRPTPQARPRTASGGRTSGVSPQRSGARGPTAAQVTRAREVAEAAAEYAAQNASAPQGWRPVPGDPSARARFNREMQSNEGRQAFGEIAAAVETWNRFVPRIVDANEEFGMETTNDDQRVALARQFRQEILDAYRVALTGAAAPEAELARIEDSLPDPGRVGFNQAWNSIRNVWRGRLAARLAVLQSEARNRFGVVPRTVMTERMAAQARNQREDFRGRGEQ